MKTFSSIPTLESSLPSLCTTEGTQSGEHIKPIHSYCATRLVLEGGFSPDNVFPTVPFKSAKINNSAHELVGECTNVHLMYPGFVFGFLHLIRFRKESEVKSSNDASFDKSNDPLPAIRRYHEVLVALAGRHAITDPGMRYESVGLLVYKCAGESAEIWKGYPTRESPVHFSKFFQRLFDLYDLRYAYPDPDSSNIRKAWKLMNEAIPTEFDSKIGFPWGLRLAADQ